MLNQSLIRRITLTAIVSAFFTIDVLADGPLDYSLPDHDLKVIRLDSAPTESFLAVRADTTGRLFVGGREALYVYEPNSNGSYAPRHELMHFPNHTWVYDIEIRGDDLYLLTVSALYRVPGARTKREGLHAERLVWGVPLGHVHQCFHGMTWGPEGDLYFSMGDPLWYYGDFTRPDHWGHWTFFSRPPGPDSPPDAPSLAGAAPNIAWTRTPYNGVGGVFRCKPDGSHFQVVARGLRNSCGLVFDRHWNLFTNDNDHESMPAEYVPGRLNHVTPHADFSWPRGWMLSKTPDRMDMLDTMITTLGRAVPVGQSYYDDAFLPQQYRNSLLVARWCTRQITFYPLKDHGATFRCDERELLAGRDLARPVHVTVGRGGRIFATICYMAHNEGSPVYKSDLVMITRADDTDDHPFDGYDAPAASADKLFAELDDPSWSRRKEAHVEILRRGTDLARRAAELLPKVTDTRPIRPHLYWIGASRRDEPSVKVEADAARSDSPAIRLQATRALDEFQYWDSPLDWIRQGLDDRDPRVQLAAVLAAFKRYSTVPDAIVNGAARSSDTYLRQATTLFMAEKSSVDQLGNLMQSGDGPARLAAVLAAGFRLTLPPAVGPIAESLPLAPWNSKEAYKIEFIDGKVDLQEWGRLGTYTTSEHWNAGQHTPEQEQLFALVAARLADADEKVRLQAAHFLYLLKDPRTEGVVAQVKSDVNRSRLALAPLASVGTIYAVGPFPDGPKGFTTRHPPEMGPLDPAATYEAGEHRREWKPLKLDSGRFFNFRHEFGECDRSSFYAFARIESGTAQPLLLLLGSDDGLKVWLNGKLLLRNEVIRAALPFQETVHLDLQPGSNDLLIRVQNVTGESGLYLHYRHLKPVAFVLPEKLGSGLLAERLKEAAANAGQTKVDPKFLELDWNKAVKEGDATRGGKLFAAGGLGCAKCHAVTAESAAVGGPSLADAARRFTVAHLVESVLLPNKTISPVFKATSLVTKEGKVLAGLVIVDTAEKVELLLPDTNRVTIAKSDIEERTLQDVSPMPAGLVKTPEELRDLLAYLLSDQPKAP